MSFPSLTTTYHRDTYPAISSTTQFLSQLQLPELDDAVTKLREEFKAGTEFISRQGDVGAYSSSPMAPDTLAINKQELMDALNVNLGGNFLITGMIHQNPALSNLYVTALIGREADEHPVDDVQIISFHPWFLYSEHAAKSFDRTAVKWEVLALPADFSVWAASPEESWLSHFIWASWDVEELKADFLKQTENESGFLKVGVEGLTNVSLEPYLNDIDAA
ncbi:hypothetical protein GYMLUDRAFT_257540 [Collybiopsis luxurians FD-317 M1]|nr:hypothetical protein GYMLUDRAFT_257540 [Collybiopsis luxurians FD-317 M1]